MMDELLVIVALGVACGGWIGLQLWIARIDPANPGVSRDCSGTGCGGCQSDCELRSSGRDRSAATQS